MPVRTKFLILLNVRLPEWDIGQNGQTGPIVPSNVRMEFRKAFEGKLELVSMRTSGTLDAMIQPPSKSKASVLQCYHLKMIKQATEIISRKVQYATNCGL